MSDSGNETQDERPAGAVGHARIGKRAAELNEITRYALWSVFKVR